MPPRAAPYGAGLGQPGRRRSMTTVDDQQHHDGDRNQALQERVVECVEVDPRSARGERAAEQGGQERPDPDRARRGRCPGRCRGRGARPVGGRATADHRRFASVSRAVTVDDGPGTRAAAANSIAWATAAVDVARPRALRRAVRPAHEGHEVLGDARPDGADRARRRDLAGRRPARHLDVPARVLRRADEPDRGGVDCARALQYGPPRAGRGQGLHRRGDGAPRAWASTPTRCSSPPAASR